MNIENILRNDPEIAKVMDLENKRQIEHIELIASENYVSKSVMEAMGSMLTNKYAEGYPEKRYYGGCEYVDIIEQIAIDRAKKLFNCDYANVQPHSGSQANFAVYYAVCKPHDTVLGMDLSAGGHLTHGSKVNFSGSLFNSISYGIDEKGNIDYEDVRRIALEHKPKMIVAGASAYSRVIDFKKFREIADEVGAVLMVDIAHIAGLVATGLHPSPFPYADVVTTTTHKTLRGPRGGMILATKEANEKYNFNKAIFPGIQGGPLMHIIAAKAICFKEALEPDFKKYQLQIIKNCKALCDGLKKFGFDLISGGSDNHLVLVSLLNTKYSGKEAEKLLGSFNITCNKNSIPNDPKSPFVTSGIRLGTPAVTSRGFLEKDMELVAKAIGIILTQDENNHAQAKAIIKSLIDKYPILNR